MSTSAGIWCCVANTRAIGRSQLSPPELASVRSAGMCAAASSERAELQPSASSAQPAPLHTNGIEKPLSQSMNEIRLDTVAGDLLDIAPSSHSLTVPSSGLPNAPFSAVAATQLVDSEPCEQPMKPQSA